MRHAIAAVALASLSAAAAASTSSGVVLSGAGSLLSDPEAGTAPKRLAAADISLVSDADAGAEHAEIRALVVNSAAALLLRLDEAHGHVHPADDGMMPVLVDGTNATPASQAVDRASVFPPGPAQSDQLFWDLVIEAEIDLLDLLMGSLETVEVQSISGAVLTPEAQVRVSSDPLTTVIALLSFLFILSRIGQHLDIPERHGPPGKRRRKGAFTRFSTGLDAVGWGGEDARWGVRPPHYGIGWHVTTVPAESLADGVRAP